ncbi:D-alanyl-D-alanine carboxypeptidase [Vibrio parahaemolyticus]|nr:D-alanyl-D-alanine carboxypeptidase [Vibrio parahaemolyticus]
MRLRWPLLISSLIFPLLSYAYPHQEVLPEGARISLVAEKLNESSTLDGIRPTDQLFPPASTLKIVTALAAKLELGDSFAFRTKLETSSFRCRYLLCRRSHLTNPRFESVAVIGEKKWFNAN